MQTSARNALSGVIEHVAPGAVNTEVTLKVSDALRITAIVTRTSAEETGLATGKPATALIKSSFVILAPGATPLVTSARNCLIGAVSDREDGAVNTEIGLELAPGRTITAIVTRQSADALGLDVGKPAMALIKASHVILAVD
jgi:molybdate transport system regulatory protein